MDTAVEKFIARVLKCQSVTVRQTAWHEAGHRFFWAGAFPEVSTRYAVVDGMPAVLREDGNHALRLDALTLEEATKYLYIKLGGIAAEMCLLGIDAQARTIAEFIADDFMANRPKLDWMDDAENGGDVSQAFAIIQAKVNAASVRQNFVLVLESCISNLRAHYAAFLDECADAERLFLEWHRQGKWRL